MQHNAKIHCKLYHWHCIKWQVLHSVTDMLIVIYNCMDSNYRKELVSKTQHQEHQGVHD